MKKAQSAEKEIISAGGIAGLFSAIAFKTGIDISEEATHLRVLDSVCNVTNNCGLGVKLLPLLFFVIAIAIVWQKINLVDDWRVGLVFYVSSFVGVFLFLLWAMN